MITEEAICPNCERENIDVELCQFCKQKDPFGVKKFETAIARLRDDQKTRKTIIFPSFREKEVLMLLLVPAAITGVIATIAEFMNFNVPYFWTYLISALLLFTVAIAARSMEGRSDFQTLTGRLSNRLKDRSEFIIPSSKDFDVSNIWWEWCMGNSSIHSSVKGWPNGHSTFRPIISGPIAYYLSPCLETLSLGDNHTLYRNWSMAFHLHDKDRLRYIEEYSKNLDSNQLKYLNFLQKYQDASSEVREMHDIEVRQIFNRKDMHPSHTRN